MGRPSIRTPELETNILTMLAAGHSLRTVCAADDMPCTTTVMRWLREDVVFQQHYARACSDRREVRKEQLLDIPLDADIDPGRGRLLSENIKWVLGKEEPKKYGEKTQLEHSGAVGSRTPAEELEHLVQKASAHPTQAVIIRAWAKELLSRIPEVEGE